MLVLLGKHLGYLTDTPAKAKKGTPFGKIYDIGNGHFAQRFNMDAMAPLAGFIHRIEIY